MKRLFSVLCLTMMACIAWAQGMPQDGKTYYIYNDNDSPLYFYNNNGALAVNGTFNEGDPAYQWKVTQSGSSYILQSASDASCYFGFKEMTNSPIEWTISTTGAYVDGNVTLFGPYGTRTCYLVMKNTGAFDQANGTFNKATTDFSSDFCFVEASAESEKGIPINIQCNLVQARGKFTLQGKTKTGNCQMIYEPGDEETVYLTGESGNAAYRFKGFYLNDENLGTQINVDGLGSVTLNAIFELNIFSQAYGEKWIRFGTVEDSNSAARSNGNDTPTHTTLDVGSEAYLWCFVGTAESYTLYNRALGSEVALSADNAEKGTATFFTPVAQAQKWRLIDSYADASSNAGYVITLVGAEEMGINSYGGKTGYPLKFWNASGAGTHWNFERVDERTITYHLTGTNPYPTTNTRVAYLDVLYGGITSHMSLTIDNDGTTNTLFLPSNEQVTVKENVNYRGYKLQGVEYAEDGAISINIEVDPNNKYQYLHYSNSPQGYPYRIPAIMNTSKGVLLSISDYRPAKQDIGFGEVDLILRRSFDNGQTWDEPKCIADGVPANALDYPHFGYGFGDAAVVADRESDEVLIICVSGKVPYPQATSTWRPCIARLRSHDGGETWTSPENITDQFWGVEGSLLTDTKNNVDCYSGFFGSGKILQSRIIKKGDYYRLYAALLCRGDNIAGAYVVYSDDFGETWNLLSPNTVKACSGSNEPKVEELPNGNIVLSGRKSYGRYFNVFKFDDDTYTTGSWGNPLESNKQENGITFGQNSCNGEILLVYGKRTDGKYDHVYPILLQSIPQGDSRTNVGIWWKQISYNTTYNYTSETISKTWNQGIQVSKISSAYSTMCMQSDNRVGFFFEEGPNEYCMVYVPLTLEEITKNEYRMYDPLVDGIEEIEIMRSGENEDGQWSMVNDQVFDLSGRRVSNPTKGLYIVNGKKVYVE